MGKLGPKVGVDGVGVDIRVQGAAGGEFWECRGRYGGTEGS